MSPRDMGKFLRALTRTDTLISQDNYDDEMAKASKRRLGWDYSRKVPGGRMYGKNGARNFSGWSSIPGNGNGSSYSEIVAYPNGMTALITANSRRPTGSPKFVTILRNAFSDHVTP